MPKKKQSLKAVDQKTGEDVTGELLETVAPAPQEKITVTNERVILIALNKVMQEVGYVQKQSKVQFGNTKYNYASEAELLATLRPSMVAVGLVFVPSVHSVIPRDTNGNTYVEMKYMLGHISGAVWPYELKSWGCGGDKGDKGLYKAITGANKYMLFKLFQIETGDDPEVSERNNADIPEGEFTQGTNAKKKIMAFIMSKYSGATDADRQKRLDMLNGYLYFQDKLPPVTSPDAVTDEQWVKMLTQL